MQEETKAVDPRNVQAEIYTWKPKNKGEVIVESKENIFIVHFDKALKQPEMKIYNEFFIKKSSFEKYLLTISKYINYFVNRYDTENELVTALSKLKCSIDKEKMFTKENPYALIDLIYELVFTDTMCQKIRQFVDDNYLDDIEKDTGGKYNTGGKAYMESLEFDNNHIKILLRISFGMKIILPIMYHYFAVNSIKPKEIKSRNDISIVYDFYIGLFPLFSDNVNMFNKLFVYIRRKVVDSDYHNHKILEQRDIFGEDIATVIERFIKKQLISENIVKYKFNRTWDPKKGKYEENIIGFNKTVIGFQLRFFVKETYAKTLTEMTNTRDSDGLSASDKMEMNMSKIDAGAIDMADINVENTLERLMRDINVPITDEEIDYYRQNHYPADIQIHLVRSIYADFFLSYRDEYLIDRYSYNVLLLLLKKKLILDAGYGSDSGDTDCILPYILTGNVVGRVNRRIIRDRKLMAELDENEDYQYLINVKYKELEELKPGWIKEIISTFINTQFTYVCYENPDLLGKPIETSAHKLCDEIIVFLKNI